ncbi:bile acid-inducible L-carnitine dehydratase protein F [Natrialba chahannaoensis JCM 10990]|uniref:Bile acid-inducible L-carnitine dehydratase protein F n=1 Tax=Natrialba chahannaoensis JCM 10990 TaxID=1227492 RepID=M0AM22_9EURY|nr:succinyl-CoA:mesaconate CoA-transferase [Natrialba chahannaoensis]ELY99770.1 bile acid-inducible L-carnitine dehydratase protein F [Natrialba chahannaoensis JCM 10990]
MGALSNLRVLDLTQVLAGPYCTMLLADMGADVVKIERPGGDLIRSNPPFVDDPGEEAYGGYFQSVNRGKRSIELDFNDDEDRADFLSLVEEADIVVENYRAGTMEKYDLGYETLTEYNPQLIYSSIRGFGDPRTGETDRQGQPSFDLIAQALGGVMEITGQEDGPPTKVGPGIGDLFTATLNCIGILAAVNHREQTGEGQYVDTGMYDSMLSLTERAIYQQSYTGEAPSRRGNSHPTLFPYDAFETADGHAVIAAFGTNHWNEVCDTMGREDLAETYSTAAERLENRVSLREEIADWASGLTNDELVGALEGRVPVAPVQTTEEIFEDPHVETREMLVPVEQPGTDEEVEIAGSPIKMTETPPQPRGRAPLLDEHREEVLGSDETTTDAEQAADD